MMDARFKPIIAWPRPWTKDRTDSRFRAGYNATLNLLEYELVCLAARNIVIQTAMREEDIRNDGGPRANARRPPHPGVILTFDSAHGPLSYACDAFRDWEDNLRGIAKTLERLRQVDMYGVTKHGEQYTGWKQIEAGHPNSGDFTSAESAAQFIRLQKAKELLERHHGVRG